MPLASAVEQYDVVSHDPIASGQRASPAVAAL